MQALALTAHSTSNKNYSLMNTLKSDGLRLLKLHFFLTHRELKAAKAAGGVSTTAQPWWKTLLLVVHFDEKRKFLKLKVGHLYTPVCKLQKMFISWDLEQVLISNLNQSYLIKKQLIDNTFNWSHNRHVF